MVKIIISNKNDHALELSKDALTSLFSVDTKQQIKRYFEKKDDKTQPIRLDGSLEILFAKIYNKDGLTLRHINQINISFFEATWERLINLKLAIENYVKQLENELEITNAAVKKVIIIFKNFHYVSVNDHKILRKVLKSTEFDPYN